MIARESQRLPEITEIARDSLLSEAFYLKLVNACKKLFPFARNFLYVITTYGLTALLVGFPGGGA